MSNRRPISRDEFEIAIICALPLEYDAAALIFDELWDETGNIYRRSAGDTNNYTVGCIGEHNVVLTLLPQMGKANGASVSSNLRSSFRNLELAFLVGICGGVPQTKAGDEILLGDVVVSSTVVQYDYGNDTQMGLRLRR